MREFFRTLMHRLAAPFQRQRLEDDLDQELRSHLEMAVEANLSKGMSAEDALDKAELLLERLEAARSQLEAVVHVRPNSPSKLRDKLQPPSANLLRFPGIYAPASCPSRA